MSRPHRNCLGTLAGLLVGFLSLAFYVQAQTLPSRSGTASSAPSSVLPAGGGSGLLDASDTAILLLDHQAGLFQSVTRPADARYH